MKSIYTIINGKPFNIIQDTKVPNNIERIEHNNISSNTDGICQAVTAKLIFNDSDASEVMSNKESYDSLVNYIKDNTITQIDKLRNRFIAYVDYSIYNSDDEETDHSVIIKPIKAIDFINPLGVSIESECVYRRSKKLDTSLDFIITNKIPFGIMQSKQRRAILKINELSIYQNIYIDDSNDEEIDIHNSIYCQPCLYNSCTIGTSLENCVKVYSTKDEGIEITPIETDFLPRKIVLNIRVILNNYIVAYDNQVINDILIENIKKKEGITEEPSEEVITESDNEAHYEVVEETTEGALRVVEDLYPESNFDEKTMIHKSDVALDIPSINIGDYVKLISIPTDSELEETE